MPSRAINTKIDNSPNGELPCGCYVYKDYDGEKIYCHCKTHCYRDRTWTKGQTHCGGC